MTDREFRNTFPTQAHPTDLDQPGNLCKIGPGAYGDNVHVDEKGTITISPKAYADDVVAFVLGCMRKNPTVSNEIKGYLAQFLDAMDERAVTRHGYSNSKAEADYVWKRIHK